MNFYLTTIFPVSMLTLFNFSKTDCTFCVYIILILLFIIFLALIFKKIRRVKSKVQNKDEEISEFQNVPPGPGKPGIVKPIDLSGNVFEHNIETLNDDMKNIGINLDNLKK
ncbi:MAG: hypothetical protein H6622_14025 [Halobacteriovoraceae bacterium]|nr:hypothetical protein [Halobacteriovoraceae bacterium]